MRFVEPESQAIMGILLDILRIIVGPAAIVYSVRLVCLAFGKPPRKTRKATKPSKRTPVYPPFIYQPPSSRPEFD